MRRLALLLLSFLAAGLRAEETGVLVYGATPAGIAAALAAAGDGERVLLVEPTDRIGGMLTSGLSHAGESTNGAYADFTRQVEAYYRATYGAESPQAKDCLRGICAEPRANLAAFQQMLAAQPKITVWRNRRLFNVRSSSEGETRAIGMAAFLDEANATISVSADIFIDATYEGDLMAAAKAPYRVGRERRAEYRESLAPVQADNQIQAYGFRLCMTQDAGNLAPVPRPEGYDRKQFAGILSLLTSGKIQRVLGTSEGCVFQICLPALPNGKYEIGDLPGGLVRLSLPGENLDWPDGPGGAAVRAGPLDAVKPEVPFSPTALGMSRGKVFDAHLLWTTGLLYFLQHDDAVPAKYRNEAQSWGLCRDEFADTGHLPPQLDVREARRLEGAAIFTQKDTEPAEGDSRTVLKPDSIATGPYQVPYGALVASDVENLLVPVACSVSHVGSSALRFEPVLMALGQAAGHAAHLARKTPTVVQRVNVAKLQERLRAATGP